jgi:hypothetical protein
MKLSPSSSTVKIISRHESLINLDKTPVLALNPYNYYKFRKFILSRDDVIYYVDSRYFAILYWLMWGRWNLCRGVIVAKFLLGRCEALSLIAASQKQAELGAKFNIENVFMYPQIGEKFDQTSVQKFLEGGSGLTLCGVGSGQQEQLVYLYGANICGVGAALDFLSGEQKEAPKLFQIIGLEWLFRIFATKGRTFDRILLSIAGLHLHIFDIMIITYYEKY